VIYCVLNYTNSVIDLVFFSQLLDIISPSNRSNFQNIKTFALSLPIYSSRAQPDFSSFYIITIPRRNCSSNISIKL